MILKLAGYLKENDVKSGTLVGVSIPKGINQVIAVYGILAAGATYVLLALHQLVRKKRNYRYWKNKVYRNKTMK